MSKTCEHNSNERLLNMTYPKIAGKYVNQCEVGCARSTNFGVTQIKLSTILTGTKQYLKNRHKSGKKYLTSKQLKENKKNIILKIFFSREFV